jgi:hypothetical protein
MHEWLVLLVSDALILWLLRLHQGLALVLTHAICEELVRSEQDLLKVALSVL